MKLPFLVTYIDPGTGSMLFTILVGVLGAGLYAAREALVKMRFFFSGGRSVREEEGRLPYVIFAESKRYWNVFRPICEEFEARGVELHYLTASPDDPALEQGYQHVNCRFIGEGNKAFAKLNMLRADILLATTPGLDVYQWKRSKDVSYYVHLLHACNEITLYRMFGVDYYDALLLCGEHQIRETRELEKLRNLPPKDLRLVGITYMDAMARRLKQAEPLPEHPLTVLLAPSWGESAILSRYGGRILDALLKCGYHVIVRPHPQSFVSEKKMIEDLMARYPESEGLEWNRDSDNFEVLRRSDILISDFSGVIFDFALVFDKPILYADTSFDPSPYDTCWLEDKTLWSFKILPKLGKQLTEEGLDHLDEIIRDCLSDSRFEEGRKLAREQSWTPRGDSAARVAEYMIQKRQELLKGKADHKEESGK